MNNMNLFNRELMKYKDLSYKDVLKNMPADILCFTITIDSYFLQSLEDDGYTEFRYTQPQDFCSKWQMNRNKKPEACAPTAHANTGAIHLEETDKYYNIELINIGDATFKITITTQQTILDEE